MTPNVARRAYSAEQLLALRESASDEPAYKIERKVEDGAIKGMFVFASLNLPSLRLPHIIRTPTFSSPLVLRNSTIAVPTANLLIQDTIRSHVILRNILPSIMSIVQTPPCKKHPTPDLSFSHHERFALSLVADTPSPAERKSGSSLAPLTSSAPEDHILRNAHSFAARSTRSFAASDTLRPPFNDHRQFSGHVLSEIDPNNQTCRPIPGRFRPSPTPSFEKRKAEQILKDHGSPPGLRVTAGGRIVPSDQSPLCSPRFGYSAIQKNGGLIRFAPNYPPPPAGIGSVHETPHTLPNGFVAQEPNGRLVQVVDGQLLPVNEINGLPQLYITAPNLNNFPSSKSGCNPVRQQSGQARGSSSASGLGTRQPTLSLSIQIQALEKQYGKLEQESRDLDKLEVLQRTTMTTKAYQLLVQKRRELVTRLNDIRISLKELKDQRKSGSEQVSPQLDERSSTPQRHLEPFANLPVMPNNQLQTGALPGWPVDGLSSASHSMMAYPGHSMPAPAELSFYVPQSGVFAGQMNTYPQMVAPAGSFPPMFNMMGIPPAEVFQSYANVVNTAPQAFPVQAPVVSNTEAVRESSHTIIRGRGNDATSSQQESPRRSHALEIKNPEIKLESGQASKSSLNPMSPSYQPASISAKPSTPKAKSVPNQANSPSPALAEAVRAHNAWVGESRASNSAGSQRVYKYESSNASFATADFFPNNPRDHSMNKQAYPATGNRSLNSVKRVDDNVMEEQDETPVTPEKEHHNPNWNPTIPDAAFESIGMPPIRNEAAMAPPGTPANGNVSYRSDPVNNRSQNNMSPKGRHPGFLQLTSGKAANDVDVPRIQASSVPTVRPTQERADSSLSSRLPTSSSGSAYMEGFRAGEARMSIGPEKSTVWLDGYCAGLRASVRASTKETIPGAEASKGQTSKDIAGTVLSVDPLQAASPDNMASSHTPLELGAASLDTLKEAVFSAQNENVILSPDSSTPAVDDMSSPKLECWTNKHENLSSTESVLIQLRNGQGNFPARTSSMIQRQLLGLSTTEGGLKDDVDEADGAKAPETRRNFSVQSQPSAATQASCLRAVYPGSRVLSSQLEWKSGSSIAQVAGLAHGYVGQFDGMLKNSTALGDMSPLTRTSGNAGSMVPDANTSSKGKAGSMPSPQHPKFVEGCMPIDGVSNGSPSSSPGKKSPTKAKFAHIAGKAGIKVRNDEQTDEDRMSPKEKPRWRDVWRKGH